MRTSKKWGIALSVLFAIISLFYLMPIAVVLINSFKDNIAVNSNVFALPNQETFVGWSNYVNGLTSGAYPFLYSAGYSFMITILSAILILLCTSMAAWYISRVDDIASRVVYFLCVFSMVVPFQMVMFTLARTAYTLKLNTPWSIPVVYLGFGAGLAVFMFSGFVKGMPLAMEEAAAIDGCGPIRTFFGVVLPIMKPIFISVGVLEIMWVWNDYLLPYLVLDSTKYKTIPIHIQYLQGSYGHVDLGAVMALIMISILPIIKIIAATFIHVFFIGVLLLVAALYGYYPTIYTIQIVYYSFCLFIFVLALCYSTCSIVVFFRDLGQIINIALQIGMWATPILWNINTLSGKWVVILKLNPLVYIVNGYRSAIYEREWFFQDFFSTMYFWIVTVVLFGIGAAVFKRLKVHFADVL